MIIGKTQAGENKYRKRYLSELKAAYLLLPQWLVAYESIDGYMATVSAGYVRCNAYFWRFSESCGAVRLFFEQPLYF